MADYDDLSRDVEDDLVNEKVRTYSRSAHFNFVQYEMVISPQQDENRVAR